MYNSTLPWHFTRWLPVPVPSTLIIWLSHCCLMLGRCFISPATARTCIDSASHSKRITSRLAAACFPLLFFYPIAFFCCFFFFCVHNLIFKTASFSISVFKVKFKLKFKHTPMCVCVLFFFLLFVFLLISIARWNICSRKMLLDYFVCFAEFDCFAIGLFSGIMWENDAYAILFSVYSARLFLAGSTLNVFVSYKRIKAVQCLFLATHKICR